MRPTEPLTRESIVDEAARLFAERGYSHTRLKDIAASFGVTHAALYYHFDRKEDILIELNREAIEGLLSMAREVERSTEIPEEEKFDHALYGHALFVAQNVQRIASLFDGEYALPEDFAHWLRAQRRRYTNTLVAMFRRGQEAGRFTNDEAGVVVSLLIGAATWAYRWYRPTGDWTPEHLAEKSVRLAAHGFLREGVDVALPIVAASNSDRPMRRRATLKASPF